MDLNTPIAGIGGIYKKYASRLEKLGILKLEDFLYHIPFRYDDYSIISKISETQPGETLTIQGKVIEIKNEYTRRRMTLQKAIVEDNTGKIDVIWFNQPFIPKTINSGDSISLSGKIETSSGKRVLRAPDYELVKGKTLHTGRLVPIYSETRGITSKWIRRQVDMVLNDYANQLDDILPDEIRNKNKLIDFGSAIKQIHFPDDLKKAETARKRLAFDELFILQLTGTKKREDWKKKTAANTFHVSKYKNEIEKFIKSLPFELTNSQKRAVEGISKDLGVKQPMNRMLEGDVGSGKTVVATISMYISFLNGYQSVLMAPTEILANQHYKTISDLLLPLGLKIAMATSSFKKGLDDFDIAIGTHAILSDKIRFDSLGLVVIDEQQRFGVKQRGIVRGKGESPHLLTMTATPIPRTVALTLYGDLDVTFLDEMPHGRKLVKTWVVPEEKRESAYKWIEKEIKENKTQAFIICPFIEESETMTTVKAASKEFERLKKEVFPNLKLGLLHGKQKGKEKNEILENFSSSGGSASGGKNKKMDILVATPVVEVGIDIPNATIMLIEASERFGLSQLHQLRGRVGRSDLQSYCLLFTQSLNERTMTRLKSMEKIYIGAQLAELDLKLRGPGDIYGTSQHGLPALKVASFSDFGLIDNARKAAEDILTKLENYPKLMEKLKSEGLHQISPD